MSASPFLRYEHAVAIPPMSCKQYCSTLFLFMLYTRTRITSYTTLWSSHFLLWNRIVNTILRTVQSVNIPIHTAIGPNPCARQR